MFTDVTTALSEAPLWAQAVLALFALTFVAMVVTPGRDYRRHRRALEGLARALGATAAQGREKWPVSFSAAIDGRTFDVSYDYRSHSHGSYRGPRGHLLITSTVLAGSRWKMHEVDIVPGRVNRFLRSLTGRADRAGPGASFQVVDNGVPVREGWFDAGTRDAVTAFYASSVARGPLWVKEQQLMHVAAAPWDGIDGPALRTLLARQAAVATAFERTAGWRGPVA
ncbi:MAG: hypothetical protein Q7S90_00955 [Rubrivivax sp.]|nr:hypothetical protein [Rubrivivax sp.]